MRRFDSSRGHSGKRRKKALFLFAGRADARVGFSLSSATSGVTSAVSGSRPSCRVQNEGGSLPTRLHVGSRTFTRKTSVRRRCRLTWCTSGPPSSSSCRRRAEDRSTSYSEASEPVLLSRSLNVLRNSWSGSISRTLAPSRGRAASRTPGRCNATRPEITLCPSPFKGRAGQAGALPCVKPGRAGPNVARVLVDGAQVLLQLFASLRRVGVFHRVGVLVVVALRIV